MTITLNYRSCGRCHGWKTFRVNLRTYKCMLCDGTGNLVIVRMGNTIETI